MSDAAGRPVSQARVYLVHGPVPLPDIAALTGADGRFALTAPTAGDYEVGCSSDGHGSVSAHVSVGKDDVTVDLRLQR